MNGPDLTFCEWQSIAPGEWVFGRKIRGVVREKCATVLFRPNQAPTPWYWWFPSGEVYGYCQTFREAIEAAERATGFFSEK